MTALSYGLLWMLDDDGPKYDRVVHVDVLPTPAEWREWARERVLWRVRS